MSVILVVEDNAIINLAACSDLEDCGFQTISAQTAEEALGVLQDRDNIAAVFTDIELPGPTTGLELAHIVRNRWPETFIVVTSGGPAQMIGTLPEGCVFLEKPYNIDGLRTCFAGMTRQDG